MVQTGRKKVEEQRERKETYISRILFELIPVPALIEF